MHPIGAGVGQRATATPSRDGGARPCRACHGADYRGTVLSRAQADRTLSTEFGTKHFWRGFQVGCYTCHRGPSSESANPNRPAVVSNACADDQPSNTPVAMPLDASDPDGNALTLRIVSQPAHGTVGLVGTTATYFPDAGFSGADAFTFAAWDGSTDSNLGTVNVAVSSSSGGSSGPDLIGQWLSVTQRCVLRCVVRGRLVITNAGDAPAAGSVVALYLSPTPTLAAGATPAKQLTVRKRLAGARSTRITLLRLPAGTNPLGQYLIAVLDASGVVGETNEGNNLVVYGPLT